MSTQPASPDSNLPPTPTKPEPSEYEKRLARREYNLKRITIIVSVLSVNLSLWGLYDQRRREAEQFERQRKKEIQNTFSQQRTRVYMETTKALGSLASAPDEKAFREAAHRFWIQYWGEMCAVEDRQIETKMVEIGRLVGTATDGGHPWRDVQTALQGRAVQLANLIKSYIRGEYGVELSETKRPE